MPNCPTALLQPTLQLLGYKKAELEGKNVSMLMPAPFSHRHNSYISNYLKSGKRPLPHPAELLHSVAGGPDPTHL
jgi:PAS domain S-box-containing protein